MVIDGTEDPGFDRKSWRKTPSQVSSTGTDETLVFQGDRVGVRKLLASGDETKKLTPGEPYGNGSKWNKPSLF